MKLGAALMMGRSRFQGNSDFHGRDRLYTPDEIARIKHLTSRGFGAVFIAHELQRDAGSVRWKITDLGIVLRRKNARDARVKTMRVKMDRTLHSSFEREAAARGLSAPALLRQLLVTVLSDNLIDAVLDAKRALPKTGPVRPKSKVVIAWQPMLTGYVAGQPQLAATAGHQ
jgi:hypothetical protein